MWLITHQAILRFGRLLVAISCFLISVSVIAQQEITSEKHHFKVETVVEELSHPWGMAFLPDGDILVTERSGQLRLLRNGQLEKVTLSGVVEVANIGQGGMLDVAIHPQFERNRYVYLTLAQGDGRYGTTVIRGQLENDQVTNIETLFRADQRNTGGRHFGSRLLFTTDGYLLVTLGDRGEKNSAQDLQQHAGSVIRLYDDGGIPKDNPWVGRAGRDEIFSYGHRNPQGITLSPDGELIWSHEHGPQGGDEINIIRRGVNYGWPVITYGVNYVIGTQIGEGTHKQGMAQPVYYWDPSIAPSGMTFYSGSRFPHWQGNLFVGSLKFGLLVRLVVEDNQVIHEERLLNGKFGRIRDVREGIDGNLYLLTDERRGKLLKLSPVI